VLGDDHDRIPKLHEHFETAARELELALDRLIAIGDAAYRNELRLPLWRRELLSQKLRRVFLDQYLCLEVQPGGKAQIFVIGSGVAVDASVLAPAIRVDAGVE